MIRKILLKSTAPLASILDPRYNEIGSGVAGPGASGHFYYTEIFAQVLSLSPAIVPPPISAPAAAVGANCEFVLKADNWTAFTDGHMTWIDGPAGLASRLNTERFPWEAP